MSRDLVRVHLRRGPTDPRALCGSSARRFALTSDDTTCGSCLTSRVVFLRAQMAAQSDEIHRLELRLLLRVAA